MTMFARVCLGVLLCLGTTSLAPPASEAFAISFKDAANGVWSSGLSSSGVALAGASIDPHFILFPPAGCTASILECQETSAPGNPFGPASYVVQGPNGTYPLNGAWAASNSTTSQWIGPRADQTNPVVGGSTLPNVATYSSQTDPYVYRLPFNLSLLGIVPGTASIQLRWLSDDAAKAQIRLCGVTSQSDPACSAGTAVPGSGNPGPSSASLSDTITIDSGFTSGPMALDFFVFNGPLDSGLNPTGLRVEILSATGNDVPLTPTPEPSTVALFGIASLTLAARVRHARRATPTPGN